jgi:hypothetical protein
MFTATFFLLALAVFVLAASVCLSKEERSAATVSRAMHAKRPIWNRQAKWPEIKAVWLLWYMRCQETAEPKRKALLSWGRTFAFCAALCVVGIVLRVELDEQLSDSRIPSGFRRSHSVAIQTSQLKPSRSRSVPATRSPQK